MWNNPPEVLRRLQRARQLLPRLSWQSEKNRFLAFYGGLLNDAGLGLASQTTVTAAPSASLVEESDQADDFRPTSSLQR